MLRLDCGALMPGDSGRWPIRGLHSDTGQVWGTSAADKMFFVHGFQLSQTYLVHVVPAFVLSSATKKIDEIVASLWCNIHPAGVLLDGTRRQVSVKR